MGNKPQKKDLWDVSMDLKFQAKQLANQSKKAEKSMIAQKKKVAKAIEKGQVDIARIYAENAIRNKAETTSLLRLSVQMEGISAKLDSAYRTEQVSKEIANSVPLIQSSLAKMNSMGIGSQLDKFEKVCEDLDVKTKDIDGMLSSVSGGAIDTQEVDGLINQVAAENDLEVRVGLGEAGAKPVAAAQGNDVADLESKLAALKNL